MPRSNGQARTTKTKAIVPPAARRSPRVALMIETSQSFGRDVFRGITRYIRENGPWSVFFVQRGVGDRVPKWLRKWSGDGIISRINTPDVRQFAADTSLPIIDLNEQLRGMKVPMISNDHAAVGCMAAEHLLQRGFEHFAYMGYNGLYWSDCRRDAFAEAACQSKVCDVYSCRAQSPQRFRDDTWELEMEHVVHWVERLPKPVGVMTCDDFRGLQLLEACAIAGIAVPQDVAVIGVGNDDVACEVASPPLSSVVLNSFRMGYEAAVLLDRLMRGEKVDVKERLLPPLDIITRQSTDVMAVADPVVSKAMRFIQQQACEGIKVTDVLRHVLVSRTVLEDRFHRALDRSAHEMILEARTKRVKELLAHTELSLADIADRAGFKHVEYLCTVFKRETGWTPTRYREEHGQKTERPFQIGTS
ncbi:MAG TPA: DNA-binding transcriptional regulator [Thermoguttaceae bacterium]|nr:DNA-binding transcriptional regulator [Thermoguttaceae bacterium]